MFFVNFRHGIILFSCNSEFQITMENPLAEIKLESSELNYLKPDVIDEYSTLKFYSDTGECVKMNHFILAAMRLPVM